MPRCLREGEGVGMQGMLPRGFWCSDLFHWFRYIHLFGLWKSEAPGGSCVCWQSITQLCHVRRAEVGRPAPPPAPSGLTQAHPRGTNFSCASCKRECPFAQQPRPFCEHGAGNALRGRGLDWPRSGSSQQERLRRRKRKSPFHSC